MEYSPGTIVPWKVDRWISSEVVHHDYVDDETAVVVLMVKTLQSTVDSHQNCMTMVLDNHVFYDVFHAVVETNVP